jgi:hypothetical protein
MEAPASDGAHAALGEGVDSRRTDRSTDDRDALHAEHLVEGGRQLGVSVTDQELHWSSAFSKLVDQVSSLLDYPGSSRVFGDAGDVDLTGVEFDEVQHAELLEQDGVHGEEVPGQHRRGLRP